MQMLEFCEILKLNAFDNGIKLSEDQLRKFYKYYELLVSWNEKMNLTAITDANEVVIKHFIDSLVVGRRLENIKPAGSVAVIDVGTGAGFPGIPLKIVYQDIRLNLLDSLRKRLKFLQQVVSDLSLEQVQITHGRAEEAGHRRDLRECYDFALARAVAKLNVLCELCLPFVKVGGVFIAQKGPAADAEIKEAAAALKRLGGYIEEVVETKINGMEGIRKLVIVRKRFSTPAVYPRKPGDPERKPL